MQSGYNNNNNNNNIIDEDYSESQTTMNPEQFEDEPGHRPYNHNHNGNIVYPSNDPYSQQNNQNPYDNRYQINDDNEEEDQGYNNTPYEENPNYSTTNENDSRYGPDDASYYPPTITPTTRPYSPEYDPRNHRHDDDFNENENDDYVNDPHQPPPTPHMEEQAPPPRRHKYSTANLREQGKWKKWCKILLFFLLMIAIMIGISMLMNHFFFGDTSDNGPPEVALRDENGTFAKDKQEIDIACGRKTMATDEGTLCKEACVPEYFHCCDPFDEFILYNYTEPTKNSTKSSNSTINGADDGKLSSDRYNVPDEKNLTFLEGYKNDGTCTFDANVRGCMAYAKCHALAGQTDPAPSNLPELCSLEQLKVDADSCTELCRKLDCCFSPKNDNCLAEKFDLCMDYAPCQNLRAINDPTGVLEIAPRTLDYDCYFQQPSCTDTCEKARCCSDVGDFSCLQYNFLSCITYAPCSNVTEVNITVPVQFNHLPQPSIDLVYACDTTATIIEPTERTCEEICKDAACCWSAKADDNCFYLDPLGCLAYEAQCQALLTQ
jgi:hypothetical protein